VWIRSATATHRDGGRVFAGTFAPEPATFDVTESALRALLDAGLSVADAAQRTILVRRGRARMRATRSTLPCETPSGCHAGVDFDAKSEQPPPVGSDTLRTTATAIEYAPCWHATSRQQLPHVGKPAAITATTPGLAREPLLSCPSFAIFRTMPRATALMFMEHIGPGAEVRSRLF
jgi:hypothetical protein